MPIAMLFAYATPPLERLARIQRWSRWFYAHTDTYEGALGEELAYFYQAIAHDTCIEVTSASPIVALLRRERVGFDDVVWRYIQFEGGD